MQENHLPPIDLPDKMYKCKAVPTYPIEERGEYSNREHGGPNTRVGPEEAAELGPGSGHGSSSSSR